MLKSAESFCKKKFFVEEQDSNILFTKQFHFPFFCGDFKFSVFSVFSSA